MAIVSSHWFLGPKADPIVLAIFSSNWFLGPRSKPLDLRSDRKYAVKVCFSYAISEIVSKNGETTFAQFPDVANVWRSKNFPATQIYREINFWNSRSFKRFNADIFEALKLDVDDFCNF